MKDDLFSLLNSLWLGFCFLILQGAYFTTAQVSPRIIESTIYFSNGTYSANGYLSLGLLSGANAIFGWFAPSLITHFGARPCLIVFSIGFAFNAAAVYQTIPWFMYASSIISGCLGSVFWAAQGTYLSKISTKKNMLRNTGVFVALMNSGRIFGTVFIAIALRGQVYISSETRMLFFYVIVAVCLLGTVLLLFLRPIRPIVEEGDNSLLPLLGNVDNVIKHKSEQKASRSGSVIETSYRSRGRSFNVEHEEMDDGTVETELAAETIVPPVPSSPWQSFVIAVQLLRERQMQQLFFVFCSTGIFATYVNTVFGTAISHTLFFGDMANTMMSVSATVYGCASLLSAILSVATATLVNKHGRDLVFFTIYIARITAYYLAFLQLPETSSLVGIDFLSADQTTYITPNAYLLLLCSVLLGFSDSQLISMVYSIMRELHPDKPSQCFMIYRFFQSLCVLISYAYSTTLTLKWELLILVGIDTASALGFMLVEVHCVRKRLQ